MPLVKRLWSLLLFFMVSVLGGVLVAGLLMPGAMAASAASTAAAESLDSLPMNLSTPPQAERSRILNADGSVLALLYDENRIIKNLDEIAEVMQRAQIAIEDHRFYEHGAIDLTGTLRAVFSNLRGVPQGGSGLTQQVVRLMQVEEAALNNDAVARAAATEDSIARKIREMRYAIAMEKKFTKDQILADYLNIAYYGDGAYGVEAAAWHFFNKSAKDLILPEAAMLAGMVQNPNAFNPAQHPQMAITRRNVVLDRMLELGWATPEEVEEAKATPFDPSKVHDTKMGCVSSDMPFICDYAEWTLLNATPSLGASANERKNLVYRGGLEIHTGIDLAVQKKAVDTATKIVAPADPVIAVVNLVEPGTGRIVAMAQSRPVKGTNEEVGETYYNYSAPKAIGKYNGFLAGSTFKIFVAAAALNNGYGISTSYPSPQVLHLTGQSVNTCDGMQKIVGKWDPHNAGGGFGTINMLVGAANSVNTYFIQLEMTVGMCDVLKMARDLGIELQSGKDLMTEFAASPSFTLGTADIAPLQLVAAYATFAARGVHCDPILITSIKSNKGAEFEVPSANCKQVISPELADAVNYVFQEPYKHGTATLAQVSGVQMAGKTGTTDDYKAIWTMGYTPNLAGGAMLSIDTGPRWTKYWSTRTGNVRNIRLPSGKYLTGGSGSDAGANLLKPVFTEAMKTRPKKKFTEPQQSILKGRQVGVPSCTGMTVAACQARLRDEGFQFADKPTEVDSDLERGVVVGTLPSGTTSIGSVITIQISKGPVAPDPTLPPVGQTQPIQTGR